MTPALLLALALAADPKPEVATWPQWRGPTRDGLVAKGSPAWPEKLDDKALTRKWEADKLGPSYSGPIVSADTVFTTEYSVRTAMEAVYTLFNVDRGVPEVFASSFDIRVLLNALYYLNDRKKLHDVRLPFMAQVLGKVALKKIEGTYLEELLKDAKLV